MGVSERRKREKEQRRTTIIDAAEKVFFAKGLDHATMDEVAQAAELSKGLLYFYFDSKDDLHHAIVHRGLEILERMFEEAITSHETGLEQLDAIGRAYVRFSQEHADYFEAIVKHDARQLEPDCDSYDQDSAIQLVARAVQNGIEDGSVRPDLDPLSTALVLWAQTHGLLQIAKIGPHRFDFAQIENFAFAFVRSALTGQAHPVEAPAATS